MKLTVDTQTLKKLVNKAIKGAGSNNVPITRMMLIEVSEGCFYLHTTDGTTTLVVKGGSYEGTEDFYAVVPIDIFSKLITKTTSENVTLTLEENNLLITGNGSYKIALPLDEDSLVKFPTPITVTGETVSTKNSYIKSVINTNKASMSKTFENPCLTGYYIDKDIVITTDEICACYNNINILNDSILVSAKVLDLLALSDYEEIQYSREQNHLKFITEDLILYTQELEGKDIYPVEPLMDLYNKMTFKSHCRVPKILLQSVVDRLALFVEPYDKNAVTLTFTPEGLQISSREKSGVELINYIASEEFEPFTAVIDITILKAQIDAYPGEEIEIWYGLPTALKLQKENITQIMSFLERV